MMTVIEVVVVPIDLDESTPLGFAYLYTDVVAAVNLTLPYINQLVDHDDYYCYDDDNPPPHRMLFECVKYIRMVSDTRMVLVVMMMEYLWLVGMDLSSLFLGLWQSWSYLDSDTWALSSRCVASIVESRKTRVDPPLAYYDDSDCVRAVLV